MKMNRKAIALMLAALMLPASAASAATDAAADLRITGQELRQKQIQEELQNGIGQKRQGLKLPETGKQSAPDLEFSFRLEKVDHNPSQVLKEEELQTIFKKYRGRDVNVKDLYAMIDEINRLYGKKGYLVARAFLLPQKIANGTLKIYLLEGKTDKVEVSGNITTQEAYVINALGLRKDQVENYRRLDSRLQRFNMLSDSQLRVEIGPGTVTGTTRYHLYLKEPKLIQGNLFLDNGGTSEGSRLRGGFSVIDRSLSGWRDPLALAGVFSKTSKAGYLDYSRQIGRTGAKMTLGLSANETKINSDSLEVGSEVKSDAQTISLRYDYPWKADVLRKQNFYIELSQRWNRTRVDDIETVRQKIQGISTGVEFLSFGNRSAFYISHSINWNHTTEDVSDTSWNYWTYHLYSYYQKMWKQKQLFSTKLNMTLAGGGDMTTAADNFYIGGPYSVRGYRKDLLAAENGMSLNMEYSFPVPGTTPNLRTFVFADYGTLWGNNQDGTDSLSSLGFGFSSDFNGNGSFTASVGFPLDRDVNGYTEDSARFDCSVAWRF